jgi:uncharacterized membrane protein YhaH (DUF805 family)
MTDVRPVIAVTGASAPSPGLTVRRMAGTIAAAVALNLVVYVVGSAAGATWLANGQTITWIPVVVATVVAMSLGWGVTALLSRRWSDARRVLAWVGLALAVVSAPAPLFAADDAPTRWALAAMHVVSGIVWFVGVRQRGAAPER